MPFIHKNSETRMFIVVLSSCGWGKTLNI